MFFHISDQPQENYPCHWQLGSFCVSSDSGWQLEQVGTAQVLYKGYADRVELTDLLMDVVLQTTPKILGNFCALVVVDNTLTIQTDRYRSFPIYIGDGTVNNLIPTDHTAWTDSMVTIHSDLAVTENKFDVIGRTDLSVSTVDQIDELLINKIQRFLTSFIWPTVRTLKNTGAIVKYTTGKCHVCWHQVPLVMNSCCAVLPRPINTCWVMALVYQNN